MVSGASRSVFRGARMSCKECAERRKKMMDALLDAKVSEAVKQAATGVVELVTNPKRRGKKD